MYLLYYKAILPTFQNLTIFFFSWGKNNFAPETRGFGSKLFSSKFCCLLLLHGLCLVLLRSPRVTCRCFFLIVTHLKGSRIQAGNWATRFSGWILRYIVQISQDLPLGGWSSRGNNVDEWRFDSVCDSANRNVAISYLKLVVGGIRLAKMASVSLLLLLLMWGRQKGDFSACAELRTLPGENCYVGSVVHRNCVIKTTGFTLLKKLLVLGKALKNWFGKCGWKRTFPSSHPPPCLQFPH